MDTSRTLDVIAQALHTAVISDVLDRMNRPYQVLDRRLRPLDPGMRFVGYARTAVAVEVHRPPDDPYGELLRLIDSLAPGDAMALALGGRESSAIFGGLLATAVQVKGGRGVVVDGAVRDVRELVELGMPTFVRSVCPLDSYGRDEVASIDVPVEIGGVTVTPGDLIVGDLDGIVVVPSDIAEVVVEQAMSKVSLEGDMRGALRSGMTAAQAFAHFGVL